MKARKSIAWRITLVLTGLVSLAVCIAALITYLVYVRMQDNMIRNLVQTESNRLATRVSRFGSEWTAPFERDMGPSMFAWGESGRFPARSLPDELRGLPVGLHDLDRGASTWHVAVATAMDGRLYVLYDSIVIEEQLRAFSRALAGIIVGCSLLAMLVSGAVARRVTTPLNVLTERLARWGGQAPDTDAPHDNEVDRLMEAFNRVQDQVDTSIADQREFSANLHHEIRTPLAVIRSDAEVLLLGGVIDPGDLRPRLKRIVKSVQEIDQSLESTYSLAHARFADRTLVNVRLCVEDIFESMQLEAGKAGLVLVNAVLPAHEEQLSHPALMTVMRNVIRNALLHAAPATLVVGSIPHGLEFTDSGPGIAATELPHIFDRYFANRRADRQQGQETESSPAASADQTGLGLAIAKRVCVIQSWSLSAASPVDERGGTRFTLRFDAVR